MWEEIHKECVSLRLEGGMWLGDLGNMVGWVRLGKTTENLENHQ